MTAESVTQISQLSYMKSVQRERGRRGHVGHVGHVASGQDVTRWESEARLLLCSSAVFAVELWLVQPH